MTRDYTTNIFPKSHSKINPKKEYDISELVRIGAFYWVKTRPMYFRIVMADLKLENVLQFTVTGDGKGKRYLIKGENIIKFYKVYGLGISLLKDK